MQSETPTLDSIETILLVVAVENQQFFLFFTIVCLSCSQSQHIFYMLVLCVLDLEELCFVCLFQSSFGS